MTCCGAQEWEAATQRDYPDCEWFFHIEGKRFDADRLDTEWERVCRVCNIPKGTILYDARRTTAFCLTLMTLRRMTGNPNGHSTDPMSDLYIKRPSHTQGAFRKRFGKRLPKRPLEPYRRSQSLLKRSQRHSTGRQN